MNNMLKIDNAELEDIPRLVGFVTGWMEQQGLNKYIFQVETAVDEACTNVIKHGYRNKGGYIEISCDLHKDDLVITIRDRGKKFDPSQIPPPDIDTDLEERKIGGLGVYMMRKMMDEVQYTFNVETGNTLTMSKKIL